MDFPNIPMDGRIFWCDYLVKTVKENAVIINLTFSAEITFAASYYMLCQFIHDQSKRVRAQARFLWSPTAIGLNWKLNLFCTS